MKEDIVQIFVADNIVYALCKSGRIYALDQTFDGPVWELVAESPRITYTPKKK